MDTVLDSEIDRNFFAFQSVLSGLLPTKRNQFAVLRHQSVVSIYPALGDALRDAHQQFSDGVFSIQQVTDEAVDLGFFSHAGYPG